MAAAEFMPTLRYAGERDVDLLLIEELRCSREFLIWFCSEANLPLDTGAIRSWDVKHSVGRQFSRREIDIRVLIEMANSTRTCILIENKLDTSEQPGQAQSYRDECKELVSSGAFTASWSGLVAPADYVARDESFAGGFSFVITYERLRAALLTRLQTEDVEEELASRLQHRAELLLQAIDKQRRGYVQIALPEKANFNRAYVALASDIARNCVPGQQMLRSIGNPAESVSMLFDARATFGSLPQHIRPRRLAHEFGRGQVHRANYVAVTFAKWGRHLKRLRETIEVDLTGTPYKLLANVTASRPDPGLVLYEPTMPVAYEVAFEAQLDGVASGLQALERLRAWVSGNQAVLNRWHSLVEQERRTK